MRPSFWRKIPGGWSYVLRIFARRPEDDVDAELRFHFDERAAELMAQGLSAESARGQALEEFGDVESVRVRLHDIDRRAVLRKQRADWWERTAQNLKYALRGLQRSPAFALAAILILGLGTASMTTVASIAYTVVAAPLPVRDASSVVVLGIVNPTKQPPHFPLGGGEYLAFARESRTLSAVAAMDYRRTLPRLITVGDTVVSIPAALVTGNFFDVVGARPLLGRLLRPADDGYGAPFVGVISEHLWRTLYNADPHVVGTTAKFYGSS